MLLNKFDTVYSFWKKIQKVVFFYLQWYIWDDKNNLYNSYRWKILKVKYYLFIDKYISVVIVLRNINFVY